MTGQEIRNWRERPTLYFECNWKNIPFAKRARTKIFRAVDPLQLSIHVVQNPHVGTQKSHWDKTNKGNYHLRLCMPFVGLAPVRLLRPNMEILYHLNGKLQRAFCQDI